MDAAAAAVKPNGSTVPILTQRDLPKPALRARRSATDEATCLFATAGFFQGVDIPGRTLIAGDRSTGSRSPAPTTRCCRPAASCSAPPPSREIDIPRAAMLLAQATGRLIRTATDRGVVAVLDRRLGTARYRWDIVNALPPMHRTRHRAEVEAFLARDHRRSSVPSST